MKKSKEDSGLKVAMVTLMVMAQAGNGHIYGNGCIYNDDGKWGQSKTSLLPRNYASLKLILIDLITGVKCRATSVAKRRS